jgi:hypothetical protein
MTALDSLGLDIEQAVISCFNGFAMDVFRAEVCVVWSPRQYHFLWKLWWIQFNQITKPTVAHPCLFMSLCRLPQQCADGPGMVPEEIKAVLMHTAGLHNAM